MQLLRTTKPASTREKIMYVRMFDHIRVQYVSVCLLRALGDTGKATVPRSQSAMPSQLDIRVARQGVHYSDSSRSQSLGLLERFDYRMAWPAPVVLYVEN
jgi:hypothetical protein